MSQRCPSCGQYEGVTVETTCPDPNEPGDVLRFSVCRNCDYGINEHTEDECSCVKVEPCERGTVGCSVDHKGQDTNCEGY